MTKVPIKCPECGKEKYVNIITYGRIYCDKCLIPMMPILGWENAIIPNQKSITLFNIQWDKGDPYSENQEHSDE